MLPVVNYDTSDVDVAAKKLEILHKTPPDSLQFQDGHPQLLSPIQLLLQNVKYGNNLLFSSWIIVKM